MVEVTVARQAGACFGVERALAKVEAVAAQAAAPAGEHRPVQTLGPLIHNPRVVASLEAQGVSVASAVSEAHAPGTLVIRSHGVGPQVLKEARAAGLTVVDATCPYVHKVHRYAKELAAEGRLVVVVGQAGHAEVEGICGHAPSACVVGSAEEVSQLPAAERVGVVAQTTLTAATLDAVVAALKARYGAEPGTVVVKNTICAATSERQAAAAELAAASDVMVVVGGKNSANTTHLAEVCTGACPHVYHIEEEGELEPAWFEGATHVGITAGASTPAEHIAAVKARIEELCHV
jgi:4-hydroxy-3-methylbut-2-enyl diphosphate reductase